MNQTFEIPNTKYQKSNKFQYPNLNYENGQNEISDSNENNEQYIRNRYRTFGRYRRCTRYGAADTLHRCIGHRARRIA